MGWQLLAAGMVSCSDVEVVLPPRFRQDGAEEEQCMVLAAWDGEMLPVAALSGGVSSTPVQVLMSSREVKPTLAAPLPFAESTEGLKWDCCEVRDCVGKKTLGVDGLHVHGARLWAWLRSGTLQVWDLKQTRSLMRWRPIYPARAAPFVSQNSQSSPTIRGVGICTAQCKSEGSEICEHELLLLGRGATSGPVLLHAVIPANVLL
eukprot:symbB.v1.2.015353.t1/scaffold1140.1/size135646/4